MGIVAAVKQMIDDWRSELARQRLSHQKYRELIVQKIREASADGWVTAEECSRVAGIPSRKADPDGREIVGPSVELLAERGVIESRRILTSLEDRSGKRVDLLLVRRDAAEKIARSRSASATLFQEDQIGVVKGPDVPAPPPPIVVQPSPPVKEDAGMQVPWDLFGRRYR